MQHCTFLRINRPQLTTGNMAAAKKAAQSKRLESLKVHATPEEAAEALFQVADLKAEIKTRVAREVAKATRESAILPSEQ